MKSAPEHPPSLRRQLRNRLWLMIASLWVLGSGVALSVQWHETDQLLDHAQRETARLALSLPLNAEGPTATPTPDANDTLQIQVFDAQGGLVWRSPRAPDAPLASLEGPTEFEADDRRVLVMRDAATGRAAVVSASLAERESTLRNATEGMVLTLVLLLPLTAWGLSWVLRATFARLQTMQQALARRSPEALQPLHVPGMPREFIPMVSEINRLLARLEQARHAERNFVANSAHELRTPVAAAQAQLQRLQDELARGPNGDAQQARTQALARQLDRLHHLCVKLMQLARAESAVVRDRSTFDVVTIAQLVHEEFDRQGHRERLRLLHPSEAVQARGDMDALAIVLRNLIENALLHTQGTVTVQVHPDASLSVTDQGPGIEPARLAQLFKPFERGDTQAQGHGLGLAIVQAMSRQMGWGLSFQSPHDQGPGLRAVLRLQAP
ncbi:HAMP domain-containing histidine kinase [Aquabacterium lacunae]|uniref:histidine kinase n=1 Tax=Aquabacterium lacunae TaxID=2528630 RepID=A0A4V6MTS9_9BURK|nr:HAMP domain-containing sensor histidine kinase [Aquabacterium lacunae]TBO34356.1 HAMP domain-containing histidine kinase [Aquabacterium lacunae]